MSLELGDFKNRLSEYFIQVKSVNTERTKSQLFLEFIRRVFEGVNADCAESLFPDLEKFVRYKRGSVIVKGSIDALLGNLIVEFERDLVRKLGEAESQLTKYVSILWSKEGHYRTNYMCMASDGINFRVYKPRSTVELGEIVNEKDVLLDPLDKVDLSKIKVNEVYLWLDRYLLTPQLRVIQTEEFVADFGSTSPLFNSFLNELRNYWEKIKESSEVMTLYNEWARYLRIVYGSQIESDELFFKHTYLAALSKLMAYMSFSGGALPSSEEVIHIFNGEAFRSLGIHNVFEEDYFSWVIREPIKEFGLKLILSILSVLARYDLTSLDEDILKTLYQELVDPVERHDLGEYYTPDWIAEYMLEDVLMENPEARILDPACGSGTFVFTALRVKKKLLNYDKTKLLEHLIENVVGVDVHPLAVIVSKANFLLAISDIINVRRRSIYIPIYLADSIRLPDMRSPTISMGISIPFYEFDAKGEKIRLPSILIEKLPGYALDVIFEYIRNCAFTIAEKGRKSNIETFKNGLFFYLPRLKILFEQNDDEIFHLLYESMNSFVKLIKENKDTIWAFILKNNYKPLFLKENFDILIGNPPWLSYRYVADPDYQEFLKRLITKTYGLTSRAELITQMELASLFYIRTAEQYLKNEGTIYFVMPRSVYSGDQHAAFRENPNHIKFIKFVDLKDVQPLFKVPSCLIKGIKKGITSYPVDEAKIVNGKLPKKNMKLKEAIEFLSITKGSVYLNKIGDRSWISDKKFSIIKQRSYYYKSFSNAATIYPRQFWFIDLITQIPKFGINPELPFVRTSLRAQKMAKKEYKELIIEGNVEKDFLYACLTSSELVPFSHLTLQNIVLPISLKEEKYVIINSDKAEKNGFINLCNWLIQCESEWSKRRSEKTDKKDVYEWLDYRKKLSKQNPNAKYYVVYPASGTNLVSCVIDVYNEDLFVKSNGIKIPLKGLIIDHTNYYFETRDYPESLYLSSIYNSNVVNALVKPMQARGQFGPRHFHKKPLEFPIPRYDSSNPDHIQLSKLGAKGNKTVHEILPKILENYQAQIVMPQHVARIRANVKLQISDLIDEIDEITSNILSSSGVKTIDQYI